MQTTTLYRPVGQKELDLLIDNGFTAWPPRLPEQPIFYPVTNEDYAVQIARDWNTKDETNGSVGYVTRFEVCSDYLSQFPVEVVGGREHSEYWIPAEQLDEFNGKIQGPIQVIRKFTPQGETEVSF
ncbi:hypothetical protein SAMN02745181_3737 [Rubritalea squalenifaciens DSM 18772]|uniref:ADP-ribosylation/crystallin J1 n=2 Tax=Rubritalea TaxID=361050 RepID=A0A1M6S6Z5_9BACT|nr:hypothetical protein [Rubritalea squalenifaciens]SHK40450.1 hypothetical protein SAMN02745181_3737 [Rubritalea squalenifaciens DSM 18772]